MPTFDDTLQRFLDDPRTGVLPGIHDPTIDSVAWHDFAQYEFLTPPAYWQPPPSSPGSGGSDWGGPWGPWDWDWPLPWPYGPWPGGPGPGPGPGPWPGPDPGPDPAPFAAAPDVLRVTLAGLDPRVVTPELQTFISTLSRTVSYVLGSALGISRRPPVPEFARRAKAAYEAALIQAGYTSRLFGYYTQLAALPDRDAIFVNSVLGWPHDPGGWLAVVNSGWRFGDAIPDGVFRNVHSLSATIQRGLQQFVPHVDAPAANSKARV